MTKNQNNLLFDKLNGFISKHYKNQLLKGGIFLIATLVFFMLLFSVIEYFSSFGSNIRSVLFWTYLILNFIILIKFILLPIFHLFRIGKTLKYTEAAKIIGQHFPEIDDKILNILQLNELSEDDNILIKASIKQKTESISSFSFKSVVNFSENKKYLIWVVVPIIVLLSFLLTGNEKIITEGSSRIIDYNTNYINVTSFTFNIKNEKLEVIQNDDFVVELEVLGNDIPNYIYIEIDGNRFSMIKNSISDFEYTFKSNVIDQEFKFYADGNSSEIYTLKTIMIPSILEFEINLDFPKYTSYKTEIIENIGDLTVLEGTKIQWIFQLKNTDSLYFTKKNKTTKYHIQNNNLSIEKIADINSQYSLTLINKNISKKNNYTILVIKDEFPKISLESKLDSLNNQLFLSGEISDDFATSKLDFVYSIKSIDSSYSIRENIKINQKSKENYYHYLDINLLNLNSSDEINYYFEVWDNDGTNGSKKTKSFLGKYKELSLEELKNKRDTEDKKIKENLNETINIAKEIQEEITDLKKDLINKKNLGWEEKNKVENIINKQKFLEEKIQKNNKNNSNNNKNQEKLNSKILDKQKKLEELMNKVLDEESKKLMEDLKKLLDEMNKKDMKEVLDKIEQNNSDLEKELDRNLELYKELEFEQKLDETINKIDELKEQQKELKNNTENKKSDSKDLLEEQKKLQQKLEDLNKDLEKLEKNNSELESKKDLPNIEEEQKEISEKMEESKNSLEKKQKKMSLEKQKLVIEELEKMSKKMKELQASNSESKPVEDMETLRQILENLITLSFNQEELINSISTLPKNSNSIVKYIQKQKKLSDDCLIIEDSLLALSKRVIQIESFINKEINSINFNIEKSINLLEERKIDIGVSKQQFVMTSLNNLALMLSETLEQMQMDMANKMPGTKQCNKPGSSSKPSLKELKKMQKKLMNEMKGKKGDKGETGKKNSKEGKSRSLMQMAQNQEKIRQRLQEIRDDIGENGEKGNIDRIIEKMEENETDILNNLITEETLLRQEEILTKLLEAEESQRERGEEEKRESQEWKYEIKNESTDYLEFIKKIKNQEELLKTTPVQLNPYFKEKVNKYFNNISDE